MGDGGVYAVCHGHGQDIVQEFRVKIPFARGRAGDDGLRRGVNQVTYSRTNIMGQTGTTTLYVIVE